MKYLTKDLQQGTGTKIWLKNNLKSPPLLLKKWSVNSIMSQFVLLFLTLQSSKKGLKNPKMVSFMSMLLRVGPNIGNYALE